MAIGWALYGPASLPRDPVRRLNRETGRALEDAVFRVKLATIGYDAWPSSPEELGRFVRAETARCAKIIQSAGIPPR